MEFYSEPMLALRRRFSLKTAAIDNAAAKSSLYPHSRHEPRFIQSRLFLKLASLNRNDAFKMTLENAT